MSKYTSQVQSGLTPNTRWQSTWLQWTNVIRDDAFLSPPSNYRLLLTPNSICVRQSLLLNTPPSS